MVKNVGGDRVDLTMLVGPNADAHVYSPSPSDAKRLSDAGLIVRSKSGRTVTCQLKAEPMEQAMNWLAHYETTGPEIFEANKDQIKDPRLIRPGQELRIP